MMASVINGAGSVSVQAALLCTCVSLVLGLVIAAVYMLQGEYTKNFVVTLLLLPALVQAVIMLVNGNLEPVWRSWVHSVWCVSGLFRVHPVRSAAYSMRSW